MLHTNFLEPFNWFRGRFLKGFYHIWTWQPSWSCDQHHVYINSYFFIAMYLKAYTHSLVKNDPVVSEKSQF